MQEKRNEKEKLLECSKCKEPKSLDEMSKDKGRRSGISSWCKECRKDNARNWSKKYPEKAEQSRLKSIESYGKNPPKYEYMRDYSLRNRYGITSEDYLNILIKQDYKCAICERDSKQMTYLLHTDHCHNTGVVRGLLCAPCNVYLGYIKDNTAPLKAAINYLESTTNER